MKKSYILVIDSGVGGVSILNELKKKLPFENYIYVADNKISPYGEKTKQELTKNIITIIENLTNKYLIKLVVFACNTITATSIKTARKKLKNIKFVGTEPPIKMVNSNEKTLILTTKNTLKHSKLLKKYKKNKNFNFISLINVAKLLDDNFFNRKTIIESLKKQINNNGYKNIVLGCTHYYFLENEISTVLNSNNLKFYTSKIGVVNRVINLIDKSNNQKSDVKIILTKKNTDLYKTINNLLKI